MLAGNYDKIGRGNVDNIVETFPVLDVEVSCIDDLSKLTHKQQLNMKEAKFSGSATGEQCKVNYEYYALKNLPFGFYTVI